MNPKRLTLAFLAVFAGLFGTDYLIHSVWLKSDYDQASYYLWRPEPELIDRLLWALGGQLLTAAAFVILWAALLAPGNLRRACLFGLFVGLFKHSDIAVTYALQPFPFGLAAKWFLASVIQSVLMGLLVFWIYRPATAMPPERLKTLQRRWLGGVFVVILILAGFAWYHTGTPQRKIPATAAWMQPLDTT